MSILSRLFGRSDAPKAQLAPASEPVSYKDFTIFVEPIKEGARYRVAARIEKEVDGEMRSHQLIRADTCESADAAAELTMSKARQMIDQLGNGIFR